jgi:asparagine synthase (glutamine-hydrolysing)
MDSLSSLVGTFAFVLVDERARHVILATDVLGSYPIYWLHHCERLVFASRLSALLKVAQQARKLPPRAVADFLSLGCVFGTKTLSAAELVPAGSAILYDVQQGKLTVRQYRSIVVAFSPRQQSKDEYLDNVCASFNAAVKRASYGPHRFSLSLSGGLDSRAILSALEDRGPALRTYTVGLRGCADEIIAQRLARIASSSHVFHELGRSYLNDFVDNLRKLVSLTDGMYLSHGLTEVLALDVIRGLGSDVLLRGHAGELAKTTLAWPLHTDAQVKRLTGRNEFVSYLTHRSSYVSAGIALEQLLTPEWLRQVEGGGRQSLQESIEGVELGPANLCSFLYLTEHHRRSTIASLELFRDAVDVRMPFADEQFLHTLLGGAVNWRESTEIHKAIIARNHPGLLRVRNSNTGAPAGAGPIIETAFGMAAAIFRRLHLNGYRHYHAFDAWMKGLLIETVERLLLEPAAVKRGIFRPPAVRRLIDDTRSGANDHGYLLQVMLILELWQQEQSYT